LATSRQQKAWLDLFNSVDEFAPQGHALKKWLFGGAHIPTSNALFDLETYKGNVISGLFGEEVFFDNPDTFWAAQNAAIAGAKARYLAEGWAEVIVLDVGTYFPSYDYVDIDKERGGKVDVSIAHDGEVTFYEGQLSRKGMPLSWASTMAISFDAFAAPCGTIWPNSVRSWLRALIAWVRCRISHSRTRKIIAAPCVSSLFTGTNRPTGDARIAYRVAHRRADPSAPSNDPPDRLIAAQSA